MLFKIIKKLLKLFIIAYLVLLVLRPESAEKIIDCNVSDGSISVAGNEIPIDGGALLERYSDIEEKASSLIPSGARSFLTAVSEWFKKIITAEG